MGVLQRISGPCHEEMCEMMASETSFRFTYYNMTVSDTKFHRTLTIFWLRRFPLLDFAFIIVTYAQILPLPRAHCRFLWINVRKPLSGVNKRKSHFHFSSHLFIYFYEFCEFLAFHSWIIECSEAAIHFVCFVVVMGLGQAAPSAPMSWDCSDL